MKKKASKKKDSTMPVKENLNLKKPKKNPMMVSPLFPPKKINNKNNNNPNKNPKEKFKKLKTVGSKLEVKKHNNPEKLLPRNKLFSKKNPLKKKPLNPINSKLSKDGERVLKLSIINKNN